LTLGLLLGAFGVGAVGSAMLVPQLRRRLTTEGIVRLAGGAMAVATAMVGLSTNLVLTMTALLAAGAGWLLTLATFNVAVQLSAPRWVVAHGLTRWLRLAALAGSWLGRVRAGR
jgi:hypothetical protein